MPVSGNKDAKGKGFDNNPQNINKNGRPKKGIAFVNEQLEQKGYTPATKADIEVNYMNMLQLSQDELIKMQDDNNNPMLIRILAENMLSGKGFDIIEKMLDRGIGKATQDVNNNTTMKVEGLTNNNAVNIIAKRALEFDIEKKSNK